MPKDRVQRKIDVSPPVSFGAVTEATTSTSDPAAPAYYDVPVVENLALTTALLRSAVTPTALIAATWDFPLGLDKPTYAIQYSTDSTFAADSNGLVAGTNSATIANLKVATLYYVRVASIYRGLQGQWSASASITTASDTTAPAVPTSPAATFINAGDLVVTWVNPTSDNFRDVEIGIYESASKVTQYALVYNATGRFVWTAAQNLAATSQVGDPTVYVELRSRSYGGFFSSAVNTGLITKSVPATPSGLTTSWASDTGTAGPDCAITWTAATDAAYYILTIDGVARTLFASNHTYTLDRNRSEHSGTPDPVLTLSLVAVDGLKQVSTAATGTATNAAPAAPTVTLTGGFSQIVCQVTSTKVADFLAYEYVWKRDGTTTRTLESASSEQQYEASAAADSGIHAWTCTVRQKDQFAQFSTATVSSTVTLDNFTIDYLRSGAFYSDSDANTFTAPSSGTLAAMKDDNLTTPTVTYAA